MSLGLEVIVYNATFNYISIIFWGVSFIGEGNRSTQRKLPACLKTLINLIT